MTPPQTPRSDDGRATITADAPAPDRVRLTVAGDGYPEARFGMSSDEAVEVALDLLAAAWAVDTRERQLSDARNFLASIASALPQRTITQSRWMVETAREGLRRSADPLPPELDA